MLTFFLYRHFNLKTCHHLFIQRVIGALKEKVRVRVWDGDGDAHRRYIASEDRFEPYPASTLKRRAVSPSVSASGSPVLSTISSPPCSIYGSSPSSNAAARAQQKPGQISSSFNLQDASGGISRMSLSE